MLRIVASQDRETWRGAVERRSQRSAEAESVVEPILDAVRRRGDDALIEYARQLDGLGSGSLRLSESHLATAREDLPRDIAEAIKAAAARIRSFAQMQMPREWLRPSDPGVELGQVVRPLGSVGAYVPGGRYPLPSTVMMTAIPAQVAGVPRIAITSPRPSPVTVGAAALLQLSEFYAVGGAQAIAAFAFGTETVPKVDRIVGPGNAYVAAAKKLLAGEVGIDFVAGPTEIALVFESGDARALAADMLAQAEHDADAAAILITSSRRLAEDVAAEVEVQLRSLPTSAVATEAIKRNSLAIVTETLQEACDIANEIAPEHLAVSESVPLSEIRHAGSIFVGAWSPEAAGDYAAGPNHVLPTSGFARLRGGLSVLDFVKIISVQKLSEQGLRELGPVVTALARAEGLEAHARSIEVRTSMTSGGEHG